MSFWRAITTQVAGKQDPLAEQKKTNDMLDALTVVVGALAAIKGLAPVGTLPGGPFACRARADRSGRVARPRPWARVAQFQRPAGRGPVSPSGAAGPCRYRGWWEPSAGRSCVLGRMGAVSGALLPPVALPGVVLQQ